MSGFIKLSCLYTENEDEDKAENLKVAPKQCKKIVRINTGQICSFMAHGKGETRVFLANQEVFVVEMKVDAFEDLVAEVDSVFDYEMNAN